MGQRCPNCGEENDIAARPRRGCKVVLVDNDKKLREALQLKDAHVMRPDPMQLDKSSDKKGNERLEIRHYEKARCWQIREKILDGSATRARAQPPRGLPTDVQDCSRSKRDPAHVKLSAPVLSPKLLQLAPSACAKVRCRLLSGTRLAAMCRPPGTKPSARPATRTARFS
jgi:hypothetical protein